MRFDTLSERDSGIVGDVYRYRYLSTSQVQRLHFAERASQTPGYRALARLTRLKLIAPFTVPNVPERIYRLTDSGAGFLADERGVEVSSLRLHTPRRKPPRFYHFMRHFLGVGDVRIEIERAVGKRDDVSSPLWIPEYASRQYASGRPVSLLQATVQTRHGPLSHTPDAAFILETNGSSKGEERGERASGLFFLEYDRGTESLTNPDKGVLRFVRFYEAALQATAQGQGPYDALRRHSAALRPLFRVLVVCESEKRLASMRARLTASQDVVAPSVLRFFWGTTSPMADPLAAPWCSLLRSDEEAYRLAAA
ncbi:MAG: replication-relaxation family protein [Bacteroidota bacterium]